MNCADYGISLSGRDQNRRAILRAREGEMAEPNCIVCGERTTCFLHGQSVCATCRKLADADEERREALARSVDRIQARAELSRRYPSLAKKMANAGRTRS